MNKLLTILEAYRNGERDLPGYEELMEIAWGIEDSANRAWIEWEGGGCPVPLDTRVDIKLRDGSKYRDEDPELWWWDHLFGDGDIIAYRIVKDAP